MSCKHGTQDVCTVIEVCRYHSMCHEPYHCTLDVCTMNKVHVTCVPVACVVSAAATIPSTCVHGLVAAALTTKVKNEGSVTFV